MMKNNKKRKESTCKHKIAFFILNLPLTLDKTCSKLQRDRKI